MVALFTDETNWKILPLPLLFFVVVIKFVFCCYLFCFFFSLGTAASSHYRPCPNVENIYMIYLNID